MAYTDETGGFRLSSVVPGTYLLAIPDAQRTRSVTVLAGIETSIGQ